MSDVLPVFLSRSPRALIPWLQVAALACFVVTVIQFVDPAILTRADSEPVADGAKIAFDVALGAWVCLAFLWLLRAQVAVRSTRFVISVAAYVVVIGGSQMGQIGFSAPVIIVGAMLLVLDRSWVAGALTCLLHPAVSAAIGVFAFDAPLVFALVNTLPLGVLASVGVLLGVLLERYDAVLAVQRRTISERDVALHGLRRKATVDKELVLAKERARAAAELHDGLGHRLTLIGMSLEYSLRMKDRDAPAAWEEVKGAREAAGAAMADMRTWVRALSPVRSTHARGAAALDEIAASFRDTGLEVSVSHDIDGIALPEEVELLLYRVVQEGLTNALRHASAPSVSICVWLCSDTQLTIEVSNPVAGSVRAQFSAEHEYGVGLRGLRDRARELGGELSVDVKKGESLSHFVLRVTVPVDRLQGSAL